MPRLLLPALVLLSACPRGDGPFEWGTATAAFQIESDNTTSDWAQWERRCEVDAVDGERTGGETFVDCESNLDGPRHWELYASDFDHAQDLGHTAYRMGLAWSKIEPERGRYDEEVLARYHQIMAAARARGLTLMVTLQHFTLPSWVHDLDAPENGLGGWPGEDGSVAGTAPIIAEFARFAGDMGEAFGADVDLWVTINEPMVVLSGGYLAAEFPPGEFLKIEKTVRAAFNMAYAHARAYDALHDRDRVDADGDGVPAAVGVAKHWRIFDPHDPDLPGSVESAERLDEVFNHLFLRAVTRGDIDLDASGAIDAPGESVDATVAGRLDWLGVNYYGRQFVWDSMAQVCDVPPCDEDEGVMMPVIFGETDDPEAPRNDLGWEIHPAGFERALLEASAYRLPLRVTENGLADADDDQRPAFIVSHLKALERAQAAGVSIRGYYHWSLMDNFEWVEGYAPRFGLLRVDFTDPARPRSRTRGAEAYSAVIAAGEVTADIEATYGTLGE